MHLGFCAIYLGRVHTETFSCVLVLFQVMSWLFRHIYGKGAYIHVCASCSRPVQKKKFENNG